MSESDSGSPAPVLSYSQIETDRFGFRIFRGRARELDAAAVGREVLEQEADIAMVRVPSASQYRVAALADLGLPVIVADTLVYYRADLAGYRPPPLRNQDLSFVACRAEQVAGLTRLVRDTFEDYRNHYRSNPLLRPADVVDAFADWAARYANTEIPGRVVWLAKREDRPVGFGACASDGTTADGVLFGVAPEARGHGVFGDLIRFCQRHFQEQGCRAMLYSTQTWNLAAQTVLIQEGFLPHDSLTTIHINSLLSRSVAERHSEPVSLPASRDCGLRTAAALESRVNQLAARYYETGFPGPGFAFLGASCRFPGPVRAGRQYQLTMSFPFVDTEQGLCKSVVKVRDREGALCLLAYHDLHRPPQG